MGAILIANCTVKTYPQSGFNVYEITTADTVDPTDTIDISSILSADSIVSASCEAATDGWLQVAAITAEGVLTIPGSTDNEVRVIHVMGRL